MKQFLIFIFLVFTSICFGQFAIVDDKDNSLNIRENETTNSKIVDKLTNGHLIYCFESKGNWSDINYNKNNKERSGYIYKNRYKVISNFPSFKISKKSENSITLKKDTIQVIIIQSNFDKTKHKFKYVKDYPTQIELIDNKQYWGMDGGMPKTQFDKIIIKVGQKTINIPKSALIGLYESSIFSAEVNYDKTTDTFYIQTSNSDGAGSYSVIWKIEKGIYKDRLIAYQF